MSMQTKYEGRGELYLFYNAGFVKSISLLSGCRRRWGPMAVRAYTAFQGWQKAWQNNF